MEARSFLIHDFFTHLCPAARKIGGELWMIHVMPSLYLTAHSGFCWCSRDNALVFGRLCRPMHNDYSINCVRSLQLLTVIQFCALFIASARTINCVHKIVIFSRVWVEMISGVNSCRSLKWQFKIFASMNAPGHVRCFVAFDLQLFQMVSSKSHKIRNWPDTIRPRRVLAKSLDIFKMNLSFGIRRRILADRHLACTAASSPHSFRELLF